MDCTLLFVYETRGRYKSMMMLRRMSVGGYYLLNRIGLDHHLRPAAVMMMVWCLVVWLVEKETKRSRCVYMGVLG